MRVKMKAHAKAMPFLALAWAAFGLVATASAPECRASQASSGERLVVDAPRATSAGTTFTAPAGWTIVASANMVVLAAPESDSRIAIVDVKAQDADSALAAGLATYSPDFKRPLRVAMPQAARSGWQARRFYEYETSPNERVVLYAMAWRAGTSWTVIVVDASMPTYEKRLSQISLILASLRPKGYQRENFAGMKAHPLNAQRIAVMREFVLRGMTELGIPGVAFSLIDQGKVVFQGGLGLQQLGKADRIDADTLFLAASTTKALTTLLLAELVDEKKFRWDEAVTEVYPEFKLGDPQTTHQVLMKHLVCACTGFPRQDLEWLFEYRQATPASSLALLGTTQPTSRFGEVFQYSNLMAAAAGYIGASTVVPKQELGLAYDKTMSAKVFRPLGMKNTTFDFARAQTGNCARPHAYDVDGRQSLARMDLNYSIVPLRPAGGLWTSARDLSKYVQMELARGMLPDGKRLVSEANLLARRAPQVPVSEDLTYGMGLLVDTRLGIPIVHHGGSMPGYRSHMMWLPDHGVGAVILTNSNSGGALLGPFMRRLIEVLFDGKSEAAELLAVTATQIRAEIAKARERLVIPADPVEARKLAAFYRSSVLGTLVVRNKADAVIFDFGEWHSAVASRKNDDGTVSFITIDPAVDGFTFVAREREAKRALIIRDAQHEYAFTEEPFR